MRDKAYLNTQSLTKSPGESLTGLDTSVGGHSSRKSNSKIFTILSFATNKTFQKNKFISNGCLVIKPDIYISIPGDGFFGRPPDSIECWRKPHKNWMKLKCEEKEERAMLVWKEFTQ